MSVQSLLVARLGLHWHRLCPSCRTWRPPGDYSRGRRVCRGCERGGVVRVGVSEMVQRLVGRV